MLDATFRSRDLDGSSFRRFMIRSGRPGGTGGPFTSGISDVAQLKRREPNAILVRCFRPSTLTPAGPAGYLSYRERG